MKLNGKTTSLYAARAARSTARFLYNTSRTTTVSPQDRATGKVTTLALRRIHIASALRFGLIFGPLVYTVVGLALWLNGVGTGHLEYIAGVLKAILLGGVGGALFALVYNAIARRYGPLKFELEVLAHESQDRPRPR